ncbi:hypothetical protein LFT45_01105 [Arthrobacter sp. FW305-BF8]|uniref:hypothetical protein n=1 Tax=Arthrobacter sp. FW305-BF8 TaxID=2879617 RepID=UPI001F359437|nr:hypothetical protein [Arthrobacter sp. FW305-BF8]UKA54594.1 hypothetical protein LFT45_01105 [Arthrobacter sp. FW305-BF8]
MQEEGFRRQIMGVISHVLSDEGTDMDVRMALLRHLGENPGSPERALMAHLRDCKRPGTGPDQGSVVAGPA